MVTEATYQELIDELYTTPLKQGIGMMMQEIDGESLFCPIGAWLSAHGIRKWQMHGAGNIYDISCLALYDDKDFFNLITDTVVQWVDTDRQIQSVLFSEAELMQGADPNKPISLHNLLVHLNDRLLFTFSEIAIILGLFDYRNDTITLSGIKMRGLTLMHRDGIPIGIEKLDMERQ